MKKSFAIFFLLVAFGIRFIPLKIPNVEFVSSLIAFLTIAYGFRNAFFGAIFVVLLSDIIISRNFSFWEIIVLSGWLSVAITHYMLRGKKFANIFLMEIIGALVFFFVTNSLVFFAFNFYPKNMIGFIQCLSSGLPFLRNQMVGNALFSVIVYKTFNYSLSKESLRAEIPAR